MKKIALISTEHGKISVQLAWDTPGQPFFAIICIPQEVIAVHEKLTNKRS